MGVVCSDCNAGNYNEMLADIETLTDELKELEKGTADLEGCLNFMKCTHEALAATAGSYERIGADSSFANNAFANNAADIAFISSESEEMNITLEEAKKIIEEKTKLKDELQTKVDAAITSKEHVIRTWTTTSFSLLYGYTSTTHHEYCDGRTD